MKIRSAIALLASAWATGCLALANEPAGGAAVAPHSGWNQWRGPTRDGQFHGPRWPSKLTGGLAEVWRVDLPGPSYSGPIVTESQVFTTATVDKEHEIVLAYDRETGEELWSNQWQGAMAVPFFAAKNGSWIRSTPAYDEGLLFVGGMRDVLVALDAEDGAEVWRVDFMEEFRTPEPTFGLVSSPLVVEDHVFVQAGASLAKVDKFTGEVVWRTMEDPGGMLGSAFSSPTLASLHGQDQVLVLSRSNMNGVCPEEGEVLWSIPIKTFRGMNILTPLAYQESVFTAAYGGRSHLLSISAGEDSLQVDEQWNAPVQGHMTSPVILDGHAYLYTRANRFSCLRLSDGEVTYTSPPIGEDYWSLLAQDEKILSLSSNGILRLIAANPEQYEVLDEVQVSEQPTWAHLAMAGDQIVIREHGGLTVFDWISIQEAH